MVCRSYRLHSTGSGESRDFTYGSSYILAGDDKEHFLESPEYVLNIQDFEAYPYSYAANSGIQNAGKRRKN